MKTVEYVAPTSEVELLEYLDATAGHCELLAGGTDLVGLLKSQVIQPDRIVNLMEIDSLKELGPQPDGSLRIGAAVTLDRLLEEHWTDDYPAIRDAVAGINSMQLQAQGTLGGEICQRPQCWFFRRGHDLLAAGTLAAEGDNRYHAILGNGGPVKFVSSSRIAPALIALRAQARVLGPEPELVEWRPVEALFRAPRSVGERELSLEPQQLITHFALPAVAGRHSATYEVRQSEGPDFPLASAAVALQLDGDVVRSARVVLGQVAPTPWLSVEAARVLQGRVVDAQLAEQAGQAAVAHATPLSHNEYKVQLAQVAVKRAILKAAGLDTGGF